MAHFNAVQLASNQYTTASSRYADVEIHFQPLFLGWPDSRNLKRMLTENGPLVAANRDA